MKDQSHRKADPEPTPADSTHTPLPGQPAEHQQQRGTTGGGAEFTSTFGDKLSKKEER